MITPLPRLFFRLYGIVLAVVLAGLLMAGGWGFALRAPPRGNAVETLIRAPYVIRRQFVDDDLQAAAERAAEVLGAEVSVRRADELRFLPPPERERLAAGEFVSAPPGRRPMLFVPLPDRPGLVVEVRPASPSPAPVPFIAAGALVLLAVGLVWLLRPLDRELQQLAAVAQAFGRGDHERRVEVGPGAATADLAARFNAMADRIARLLDDQRNLLLAVSHEIRTPLNRLRFAAELLAEEAEEAQRDAKLSDLHHDLDELDELVAELLTFFRLERAEPVVEPVRLEPLVRELVADAERLRPGLETTVRDVDHVVHVDAALLRRALSSALANAARYADGRLEVSAVAAGAGLTVYVDDDGPGIPEADRERVLEPFVRLDAARARDAGGSGLGLAVANRIVGVLGGRLTIGTSPLGGARVAFELTEPDAA